MAEIIPQHAIPQDDTAPHTESEMCHCNPHKLLANDEIIIIHNAFFLKHKPHKKHKKSWQTS